MTDDPRRPGAPGGAAPPEDASGIDLLTIGLLVFFVSLLLIVAALLALPVILG